MSLTTDDLAAMMQDLARDIAALARNVTTEKAIIREAARDDVRSFPLNQENQSLVWALYRWKIADVKTLHRTAGLPLRTFGEGHGKRYVLVVAAVDRWLLQRRNEEDRRQPPVPQPRRRA